MTRGWLAVEIDSAKRDVSLWPAWLREVVRFEEPEADHKTSENREPDERAIYEPEK